MSDLPFTAEGAAPAEDDAVPPSGERTETDAGEAGPVVACVPEFHRRRRRIDEHCAEGLEDADALDACLVGMNSDFMDLELMIAHTVRRGLKAEEGSPESIEYHRPNIEVLLRLSKQIVQLTQLRRRLRKDGGEEAGSAKPR